MSWPASRLRHLWVFFRFLGWIFKNSLKYLSKIFLLTMDWYLISSVSYSHIKKHGISVSAGKSSGNKMAYFLPRFCDTLVSCKVNINFFLFFFRKLLTIPFKNWFEKSFDHAVPGCPLRHFDMVWVM